MHKPVVRLLAVVCMAALLSPLLADAAIPVPVRRPAPYATEALAGASLWTLHRLLVERWRHWHDAHEVVIWSPVWAGAHSEGAPWGIPWLRRRWRPSPVVFAANRVAFSSTPSILKNTPHHEISLTHQEHEWVAQYVIPEIEAHAVAAEQSGRPLVFMVQGMLYGDPADQYEGLQQWMREKNVDITDDAVFDYFNQYVQPSLLALAREMSAAYRSDRDALIPINRYAHQRRVPIVYVPMTFGEWRLRMSMHAETQQTMFVSAYNDDAYLLQHLHRLMDLEETLAHLEKTSVDIMRHRLYDRGNYVLQLSLDMKNRPLTDAQLEAYGPWSEVLRRRLLGRPLTEGEEDVRFLQLIPFNGFLNHLRQEHPDWPMTSRQALAARLARRWTPEQLKWLRWNERGGMDRLRQWTLAHATLEERVQLGFAPIPRHERIARGIFDKSSAPFSYDVVIAAPRAAQIHYQRNLYALLQFTNPNALARIERILSHPFSALVEGVDYDRLSGARSLLVALDAPLEIDGQRLAAIQLKGVVYDPQLAQQPFNIATFAQRFRDRDLDGVHEAHTMDVDRLGIYAPRPYPFIPMGGGRAAAMKREADASFHAFAQGVRIGIPVGWVEFPDSTLPDGEHAGAVLLGKPDLTGERAAHRITKAVIHFQHERDEMYGHVFVLFDAIARAGAFLAEAGFAHTNLHLNNFSVVDDHVFIHDAESIVRDTHSTAEQYFGTLVVVLRNLVSSAWQLNQHPALGAIALELVATVLDGFFGFPINPMDISSFVVPEFERLAYDSQQRRIPFWRMDHPIVHALMQRFVIGDDDQWVFRHIPAERFLSTAG